MKRTLVAPLLLVAAACAPVAPTAGPVAEAAEVRNIILLIADGAGIGAWTTAYLEDSDLAVGTMPVMGLVNTTSASHRVTDSAAAATAYATGERASYRNISVGPSSACPPAGPASAGPVAMAPGCAAIESWFAIARDKGKATGVVTTAAVVDATPAAFIGHSPSRYMYDDLAEQAAAFGLDVMLGGGAQFFASATRADHRDLAGEICAASTCATGESDLLAYPGDDRPLVGWFANDDMDEHSPRPVTVPTMVTAALKRLSRDGDGFVAMFETEATDNAGHNNVPMDRVAADVLEFDRAVGIALEFARRTPGTLVIATADHETGGLSLPAVGRDLEIRYSTGEHTGALVPLFAFGPGSERFGGLHENYEIGRMLLEIARGW